MEADMCQVLPDFYKQNFEEALFICVSVKDYKLTCLLVNTLLRLIGTLFVLWQIVFIT